MGMKYAEDPFNIGMFFTQGVLQNGYIFRPSTHTSGHFYTGVAPPPPGFTPNVWHRVLHFILHACQIISLYLQTFTSLFFFYKIDTVTVGGNKKKVTSRTSSGSGSIQMLVCSSGALDGGS